VSAWIAAAVLLAGAAAFAAAGMLYARRRVATLEDWITARGTLGPGAGVATLVASGMGAWILFGPAEAATWGGIAAVAGYAIGSAAPLFVFVALGVRLRRLMPEGHSLGEYVRLRYGPVMHALTLAVTLFYLVIFLTAEMTGMALIAGLVTGLPLWATAVAVMTATLAYTGYGGLRASIFTDGIQFLLMVPLLVWLVVAAWQALGGAGPGVAALAERAPQLLDPLTAVGLEGGLTLIIAILLTNLFHQGYWQRVFAARDERSLRTGFIVAGVVVFPIVFAMGLFGLAFVAVDAPGEASTAVFAVVLEALPAWAGLVLILLGLVLVMSSADTILNAVASLIAVDLQHVRPAADGARRMRVARLAILALAVPVVAVAAQGFSVLYLFLLADLLCAAAAFPVFYGLYNPHYSERAAVWSLLAGLAAGAALFPAPDLSGGSLLGAFVLAATVPAAVSLAWPRRAEPFDFAGLRTAVRPIAE